MTKIPGIFPVIIGAPFGNYLWSPACTSTLGTYTQENRAGFLRWRLAWRILRTLRPRFGVGGWTNKLGLPNPGIKHLIESRPHSRAEHPAKGKIVSIHGFSRDEWVKVIYSACHHMEPPAAIELNISCPNVGHISVPDDLFKLALDIANDGNSIPVIVKLPPVSYWPIYQMAYDQGIRNFHCCNTLPSPSGGLSGKVLQRVSLDVIARIKDKTPEVVIIGGGGITGPDDIELYWKAGARHFAVASALLKPHYWVPLFGSLWLDSFMIRLRARVDEMVMEMVMMSLGVKPPDSTIQASR